MTWIVLRSVLFGLFAAGALGTALLRWRRSSRPQRIAGMLISVGLFAWFVASLTRSGEALMVIEIGGGVLVLIGSILDYVTRPDTGSDQPAHMISGAGSRAQKR